MSIEVDTRPQLLDEPDPTSPLGPEVTAEPGQDDETKALLEKAGLDHVPTADEAKALLDARRKEIRHAVMVEADRRDWCEEGTRKVCANLRLERPGGRTQRTIDVEVNLTVTVPMTTYTEEGALSKLLTRGILSPDWMRAQLYATKVTVAPIAARIDGVTQDLSIIESTAKPEVTA